MVAKNIAYLYSIQLLRLCLPLVLLSVLTKVLTGAQYSIYVYTLACAAWLSIVVEYGFNVSATRRIAVAQAAGTQAVRGVILETQAARWLLAGATLPFLAWSTLASSVLATHAEWAWSAWLLGVMSGMTPTYYFQAVSRLRAVALLEVGGGVLTFSVVMVLIRGPEDFWWLGAVLVLVRLAIWQMMDRTMHKEVKLRRYESLKTGPGLIALKDGWRIFLVQAAASLYTSFNIVLLGGVSTAYAVAVYGSAERLIRAGVSFIGQATAAIFPKLNTLKASDAVQLSRARRLTLIAFTAISAVCLPLIWALAPLISNTLFHGKLPELTTALRVMAFVVPAIAISNVLAIHFLVVDHQENLVNRVVFAAVPISLVSGYVFASEYGATGMAASWVAVEWLVSLGLAAIIYRRNNRLRRSL